MNGDNPGVVDETCNSLAFAGVIAVDMNVMREVYQNDDEGDVFGDFNSVILRYSRMREAERLQKMSTIQFLPQTTESE